MSPNEAIAKMRTYVDAAIENLEYGMNVVESNDDFNESQNEEVDSIYEKLSKAIDILNSI